MALSKKSLLESIKNLAKSESSKEQEERKKKLAEEKKKETAKGDAGENAASLKIVTMLESQLLAQAADLEKQRAEKRDLEKEVQKLREDRIRLESERKVDESKQALNTILQLVETFNPEDSETKEKPSQKKSKNKANKASQEKGASNKQKSNEGNDNVNKNEKKTNFGGNLNNPDQRELNKCENKLFDKQNVPQFNPSKVPPLLPNFNQSAMQNNQPNNFNQPGPMANSNCLPHYPNLNQSQQYFNQPPMTNQQMTNQPYPNQNAFLQNPNNIGPYNNFNQPGPGFNIPPAGFNTFQPFQNQDGNFQHNQQQFRGRGGFNRGRGNFRGNERGGNSRGNNSRGGNFRGNARGGNNKGENFRGNMKNENFRGNTRMQFGGNNGPNKLGVQEKDGFIVVSKDDIPRKPGGKNSASNNVNQLGGGDHSQNNQKSNFKKKRNRNRPERQNKEEKEKEEEIDSESIMQGMIDVFSKMFGSMTSQPAKPKADAPQPTKPNADAPQTPPAAVSPGPNQETGAIKKDIPGKQRNKPNKKKDGNQQPKDNKEAKNNPLKLFVGEYPSEEEALARNINPRGANNNKSGEDIPAIRITNLSERTRLNDLEGLVKPFGVIKKRYLALHRETGVCKGFAYVHFQHKKSAEKAIEVLNGYLYDDIRLSVQWTFPANKN